jgi:hypothetical protein
LPLIFLILVVVLIGVYFLAHQWPRDSKLSSVSESYSVSEPSPVLNPPAVQEKRHFFAQVHGIHHKNTDGSSRQRIIRSCQPGELVLLVPEPDNPADPDALKVCRQNGEQLGYVTADLAFRLTADMAIGWTYRATVEEIYSFADRPHAFGCRLRIGVLTMSTRTEQRLQKKKKKTAE